MIARHLIIKGKVQGVWYRGWTVSRAQALELAGWVRNLSNGDVEAWVQGPDEAVRRLIEDTHIGPPAAHVTQVEVGEVEVDPVLAGFEQRATV